MKKLTTLIVTLLLVWFSGKQVNAQSGHQVTAGSPNIVGAVSVTLFTSDLKKSGEFYENIIGLSRNHLQNHPDNYSFRAGNLSISLRKGKIRYPRVSKKDESLVYVLAISVKNLKHSMDLLTKAKIPFKHYEGERADWLMVKDPGGNIIELAEFKN